MTDIKSLVADPSWFPDGFDAASGMIRFARIGRDNLSKEPFLDQRKNPSVSAWAQARLSDVAPLIRKPPPPSLIFHTSFCGSTLIARALDMPGKVLSLKEPNILLDLANARRVAPALRDPNQFNATASVIFALLARQHAASEKILIKPTNAASPLAAYTNAQNWPAIFMYGDLRGYLISTLKKGEEGRQFVRQQFNIFTLDQTGLAAIEPRKAMSLTDLQVAALVWRHQIEEFELNIRSAGHAASLSQARMIETLENTLAAAASHLALPLNESDISRAVEGPVFKRNSKFADQQYDTAKRQTENEDIERRFAAELELIGKWAEPINLGVDLKLPLSRPL